MRFAFSGLMLLIASSVAAQTATTGTPLSWDQAAPDLATAQSYSYAVSVDAQPTVVLTATCVAPVPPATAFNCSAPFPAATPGAHTLTLTASNAAGVSAPSAPLAFTFVVIPATPTNLRIGK